MDQYNLKILSGRLKIAPMNIVRENVEIEILHELSRQEIVNKIVFYGGTALRLAYGSPRFSEDLDFMMLKKVREKELMALLRSFMKDHEDVSLKDFKDKRNTLLAVVNVVHRALKHPLNIKVELHKEGGNVRYEFIPLSSPCSHLAPIVPTVTMESFRELKQKTLKRRQEPRDWFDLYYITKYLKQPWGPREKFPFDKKEFKREMKRFLPQDKWVLIDQVVQPVE